MSALLHVSRWTEKTKHAEPSVGEFSPAESKTPKISDVHRSELGAVNDLPAVLCEMFPYLQGEELRVDIVAAVHLLQRGSAQALVQCLKGILWAEVWEKSAGANFWGRRTDNV